MSDQNLNIKQPKRKMRGVAGRNFILQLHPKKTRRDLLIHCPTVRHEVFAPIAHQIETTVSATKAVPLKRGVAIVPVPQKERQVGLAVVPVPSVLSSVGGGIVAVRGLAKVALEVPPARQALWEGLLTVLKDRMIRESAPHQKFLETTVAPLTGAGPELYRRQAMTAIQNARSGIDRAVERTTVAQRETLSVICTDMDDASCLLRLRRIIPEAPAELLGLATEARVRHALFEFDRCTLCDSPLQMDVVESSLLCTTCGSRRACPDPGGMAMSVTYYNLDRRLTLLGHKRLSKLREYLKQLLAKQKSVVPMAVILDITAYLVNVAGLKDPKDVTYRSVHAALVALDMRNFFDYCTQIYCSLRGCPPPTLHPEYDEALCVLFAVIQRPFEELKEKTSSTFFSISYLVLTLCKFLRLVDLIPFITLSHTPARLYAQEKLLRLIFEKLNWTPFPALNAHDFL